MDSASPGARTDRPSPAREALCADRTPRRRTRTRAEVANDGARGDALHDEGCGKIGVIAADVREHGAVRDECGNRRKPCVKLHELLLSNPDVKSMVYQLPP